VRTVPCFNIATFFTINFLLTMNPCRSTNVDTSMLLRRLRPNVTYRKFYIMSEVRLGDFAHNVGQWIILNHAIVYDETIGCCICGQRSPYIQSLIARPWCPLLTNSFCREQLMITNGLLRKKSHKERLGDSARDTCIRSSPCRNAHTSRTESVFIKIQIQVIIRITFRI